MEEILRYASGAALLMMGRADGLKRLDLSADGFWTSFFSIAVALPAMALSWIEFESIPKTGIGAHAGPMTVYAAHAMADLVSWILPVLVLMCVAPWIGFTRKIVPLVVATNWGGALLAWGLAPLWLMVIVTGETMATFVAGLVLSAASIVVMVRLSATSIGGDLVAGIAFVVLMIVTSLVSYGAIMDLTGVPLI